MACYYYNCLMCGQGFMEDRVFSDNTVVCPNCQAFAAQTVVVNGKQAPQAVRVSFRCAERLDWSLSDQADPSRAFGRSTQIATKEQVTEYLKRTKDPFFASNFGVKKIKLPVQDPPYNLIRWVDSEDPEVAGSVIEEMKSDGPPPGYADKFDEIGAGYDATEKLLKLVSDG
jgi:hypothetical protein